MQHILDLRLCCKNTLPSAPTFKACYILQTLVFLQKEDCGFSKESQLRNNREEVEKHKKDLEKNKTRYQIVSVEKQEDASIIVRVKKHLNDKTDVSEYWD